MSGMCSRDLSRRRPSVWLSRSGRCAPGWSTAERSNCLALASRLQTGTPALPVLSCPCRDVFERGAKDVDSFCLGTLLQPELSQKSRATTVGMGRLDQDGESGEMQGLTRNLGVGLIGLQKC